jgi:hypothetical protein
MKFGLAAISPRRAPRSAGFTLAEVLAALAFMAIVIPVAIEGMHVASGAGEKAARRNEAAMVAEQILSGSIITGDWSGGVQNGTIRQGLHDYTYNVKDEPWLEDVNAYYIRLLSVEVTYSVQGVSRSVQLSTLVDQTQLTNQIGGSVSSFR